MRFQSPWGLLHAELVGKALDSQRAEEVISFFWDTLPITALELSWSPKVFRMKAPSPTLLWVEWLR